MDILQPRTTDEVVAMVADAAARGRKLEIRGGGSKAAMGAPDRTATILDMTSFDRVIDYDPAELVLTVGPGVRLADIEALVAGENQMLAFDPFDHGPIFGASAGATTIGGVIAAGVAGSRRLSLGSARDHLLGFEAVSGRGERFIAGGKVVKNVTGFDLSKLMTGSWGRLAALTEVTLKVLPRPRIRATLMVEGLSPRGAYAAMTLAMRAQAEVAAAAHLPAAVNGGRAMTAVLLQGFEPSVEARCQLLGQVLEGAAVRPDPAQADAFWGAVRTVSPLAGDGALWRINVVPSLGCAVVASLEPLGARWLFDWAGGLVWLAFDGDPALVRQAADAAGGHATLVRGPAALRRSTSMQHPEPPAVAALSVRIRRAFDPTGVFETGRFGDLPHAD